MGELSQDVLEKLRTYIENCAELSANAATAKRDIDSVECEIYNMEQNAKHLRDEADNLLDLIEDADFRNTIENSVDTVRDLVGECYRFIRTHGS